MTLTAPPTALARILAYKREEVAAAKSAASAADLTARARDAAPVRGFGAALQVRQARGELGLIAEVKKASPSKGVIRADFDPAAIAAAYAHGGADCLSVLTDGPSFQGSVAALVAARAACTLPVLRKDFMIDPWQVTEARAMGADAILIIMAAVEDTLARELMEAAAGHTMDALIEVHDSEEMARAVALNAAIVGINNRDLRTFETRLETTEELAKAAPEGALLVAESGIAAPADVSRLARAGAHAFLVGESLMRQPDPGTAAARLMGRNASRLMGTHKEQKS